jgi:hypothetical protein
VKRATESERRRRLVSLILTALVLVLCLQAESIHWHAGTIHHRDCPICNAVIAAHSLVSGTGVAVGQPVHDVVCRIPSFDWPDVLQYSRDPSVASSHFLNRHLCRSCAACSATAER